MKVNMPFVVILLLLSFLIIVVYSEVLGQVINQDTENIIPQPFTKQVTTKCLDFFQCRLMQEIIRAHKFLYINKRGLPYTPDPRLPNFDPEVYRLLIDTQAHGYLNLYKLTGDKFYLKEATDRLDYMVSRIGEVLGNGTHDGMVGHTFLYAYELTNNQTYLRVGINIADQCLNYTNKILNWGYMCAMVEGKAYKITGNFAYLNDSRNIIKNTDLKQFPDGSFPHQTYAGPNTGYTSWMIYELLEYRKDDNYSPYADIQIIKGTKFLLKRVNPDGSINYEDENGTYYYDYDLSSDPRGWLGILPGMAYEQKVFGRDDVSKKILEFLFSHQLNGSDVGGYPGKWGYFDPNETWETGTPLIKGTSMIFWYLTAIPLINTSCQNGIKIQCEVTPDNCSPAFIDLNACNAGFRGDDTCINGVFTHCLNYTILKYNYYHNCAELSRECHPLDPYCEKVCYLIGSGRCIENTNYCGECFDTRKRCTTECQPDPIPECEVEP